MMRICRASRGAPAKPRVAQQFPVRGLKMRCFGKRTVRAALCRKELVPAEPFRRLARRRSSRRAAVPPSTKNFALWGQTSTRAAPPAAKFPAVGGTHRRFRGANPPFRAGPRAARRRSAASRNGPASRAPARRGRRRRPASAIPRAAPKVVAPPAPGAPPARPAPRRRIGLPPGDPRGRPAGTPERGRPARPPAFCGHPPRAPPDRLVPLGHPRRLAPLLVFLDRAFDPHVDQEARHLLLWLAWPGKTARWPPRVGVTWFPYDADRHRPRGGRFRPSHRAGGQRPRPPGTPKAMRGAGSASRAGGPRPRPPGTPRGSGPRTAPAASRSAFPPGASPRLPAQAGAAPGPVADERLGMRPARPRASRRSGRRAAPRRGPRGAARRRRAAARGGRRAAGECGAGPLPPPRLRAAPGGARGGARPAARPRFAAECGASSRARDRPSGRCRGGRGPRRGKSRHKTAIPRAFGGPAPGGRAGASRDSERNGGSGRGVRGAGRRKMRAGRPRRHFGPREKSRPGAPEWGPADASRRRGCRGRGRPRVPGRPARAARRGRARPGWGRRRPAAWRVRRRGARRGGGGGQSGAGAGAAIGSRGMRRRAKKPRRLALNPAGIGAVPASAGLGAVYAPTGTGAFPVPTRAALQSALPSFPHVSSDRPSCIFVPRCGMAGLRYKPSRSASSTGRSFSAVAPCGRSAAAPSRHHAWEHPGTAPGGRAGGRQPGQRAEWRERPRGPRGGPPEDARGTAPGGILAPAKKAARGAPEWGPADASRRRCCRGRGRPRVPGLVCLAESILLFGGCRGRGRPRVPGRPARA